MLLIFFFFNDTATTEIYTLSLHDALPILAAEHGEIAAVRRGLADRVVHVGPGAMPAGVDEERVVPVRAPARPLVDRSEEHTSELQSRQYLVCRLLLEKKKNNDTNLEQKVL